jgi:hypothetical protein
VDITIKKVGQRDGGDRFVLVHLRTRRVITTNDVSERSLRRFFQQRGVPAAVVDRSLERARERYDQAKAAERRPVNQAAETIEDQDLLFELGLDDEGDIH